MRNPWKTLLVAVAVICVGLMAISSLDAKGGGGKSKSKSKDKGPSVQSSSHGEGSSQSSTPPGWSKGRKTGWGEGKYPPGWSKWNDKKKNGWRSDRTGALTDIDGVCVRYRIQEQKRNQISQAFDEAIAGGLIINEARKKLVTALQNADERRALMIDTSKSVLDLLN